MIKRYSALMTFGILTALGIAAISMSAGNAWSKGKPTDAKLCLQCHKTKPGNIMGRFESVAFKSRSMQISIDEHTEIIKFDPDTLKVLVKGKAEPAEALRGIKRGHEVRVEFAEKDGAKVATLVVSKPPVSVPAEKLISTDELMKLVALGPEKGKYFLVDSRPAPRFYEGAIPTAVNIPDAVLPAQADKLPTDKNILLIFYCGGVT